MGLNRLTAAETFYHFSSWLQHQALQNKMGCCGGTSFELVVEELNLSYHDKDRHMSCIYMHISIHIQDHSGKILNSNHANEQATKDDLSLH